MHSPTVDLAAEHSLSRSLLTVGGLLFFAIAIVGVCLPGIPTTGPLILASMMLGKANPELRRRVLETRAMAPYRGYVDGSKPFTRQLRSRALLCMWISIVASCGLIYATSERSTIAIAFCLMGGVLGSIVILRYRRQDQSGFAAVEKSTMSPVYK